jgi:hypothetical protein
VGARLARHAGLLHETECAFVDDVKGLLSDERDSAGSPVVRIRAAPRALLRRAVKLGSARVCGSAAHDLRGSARAVDALLDAFADSAVSGHEKGLVFALSGVTAEIVRDGSGRGEILLSRPCRGGPQSA